MQMTVVCLQMILKAKRSKNCLNRLRRNKSNKWKNRLLPWRLLCSNKSIRKSHHVSLIYHIKSVRPCFSLLKTISRILQLGSSTVHSLSLIWSSVLRNIIWKSTQPKSLAFHFMKTKSFCLEVLTDASIFQILRIWIWRRSSRYPNF